MRGWPAVARAAAWSAALYSAAGLLFELSWQLQRALGVWGLRLLIVASCGALLHRAWRAQARIVLPECALGGFIGVAAAAIAWNAAGAAALSAKTAEAARAGLTIEPFGASAVRKPDLDTIQELSNLLASDELQRARDSRALDAFLAAAKKGKDAPKDHRDIEAILARRADLLRTLDRTAALPDEACGRIWDYDAIRGTRARPGYGTFLAQRLSAARAVLKARAGKAVEAAESVRTGLAAGRCTALTRDFFGALSDRKALLDLLPFAGQIARGAPAAAVRWRPLLDGSERERAFRETLDELIVVMPIWAAHHVGWWDVAFGKYRHELRAWPFGGLVYFWPFMKLDAAIELGSRIEVAKALRRPFPEIRQAYEAAVTAHARRAWVLSAYALPQYDRTLEKVLEGVAASRAASAALKAQEYRAARGRWPSEVEELDPFTGTPLRAAAAKDGFLVYSVGPDGKDDGGADFDEDKETGDLAVRL